MPSGEQNARTDTAYGAIRDHLRREIAGGTYGNDAPLPTEFALAEKFGVSRQTVRRAFQDLVSEGLVYRIPGRGTFVTDQRGRYVRSLGSIDDLLALSADSDLELLTIPEVVVDAEASGRLALDTNKVVQLVFRRLHEGRAYCYTVASMPTDIGARLAKFEALASTGVRERMTVLELVRQSCDRPIVAAEQTITAVSATATIAKALGTRIGDPMLRIDRLYSDDQGRLVESAVNFFNPHRYAYQLQMRATREDL